MVAVDLDGDFPLLAVSYQDPGHPHREYAVQFNLDGYGLLRDTATSTRRILEKDPVSAPGHLAAKSELRRRRRELEW